MGRFRISADGTYEKYVNIGANVYKISIPQDIWNSLPSQRIYKNVYYWISQRRIGKTPTLKYGSFCIVDDNSLMKTIECIKCNKKYKTRSGLLKHIKKHHPPSEPTESPTPEPSNERTVVAPVTNIANQTNNIQVNLPPLRNFTEENHKWLTHDVIMEAIRDIPTAIPYLIKEKHFNDRFPENQNVRLDNKRSLRKRLKVYDGGMWRLKERPDVEFRLIKQMYDVLFDFVEMMTDEEEDELDDDATPIDRRITNITRRIRTSEMRRARVRQSLRDWDEFKDSIEDEYEKTIEPFKDKLDTYLLDMDLRLEQLRERRAMLMA
jgi:hypothetical protein